MSLTVIVLACALGFAAASPVHLNHLVGLATIHDDGQWRPHHDGSVLGSGAITWLGADLDDGQWKPHLDNSLAGVSPSPFAHLVHHLYRRSVGLINPNSLPVPLDTVHVALAKQAQLIQQHSEGTRNILGGGIPLHLPADTHEVAIGKQAHAIAHASQKALTHSAYHSPLAHVAAAPVAVAAVHHPLAYSGLHGLHGIHGIHGLW